MAYPPPLDKIIGDYMKIEIEALMFRLRMGEITVEEWQTALINLLGIGGAAAYMAGLGQDDLNDKQKDALGEFVDGQMKFVAGFAAAMALWLIAHGLKDKFDPNIPIPEEETDPWAKWRARAQLYAPTVASIYWQGRTEDLPLPAMPGDGTSQCLTNCRCEWKIVDVDHENGDFDAYWLYDDDPEVRHCQTCLQRSEDWNPLQIRNWELVLPHMREARQAAEQLRVKFHTALKGGSGSGNFNHRGRPGKVGGSAARVTVHKSLDEFLNSQHPFQSIYAFFVSTYGEVLSATDASLGGHEMIARGLAKNPKYDIDKKMAKEHDFEMAAVSSGKLIRCELSAGKKTLYVQANPFTTKHLHALQAIILNNPGIEKVVIEGWRVGDIYSPDYAVIRRGEVTFDEFISANKVIIRDSEVGLKERLKGGNGSGNFNHAGRPGEVGGSTPASFDEGFVDSYEQLTNSEYGKAFLITPDDRLINTPKGHPHFLIHHRDHWNYLGITPEDGNPKYPNDMTKPMLAAYKAGTIRIREMDKPAIYTQRVDNSTLRRLQRLVNEGKIRLDKSYNTWTSGTKYITFTAAEFMAASKVIIDPVSREPILKEHRLKGGPGSGNFGHAGRPGLVGGSAPETEGIVIEWSNTGSGEWTGECGDYLITIREDNGFYRHKIYDGRQQLREKGLSEDLDGAKESARQDLNRIIEADDTEPEIAIRPMVFDNAEQMFNALREWKASEGLGLNAVGTWGYFIGRNGKVLSFPGQYEHIDALRLIQTEYPDISKAMGIEDEIESQKPTGFAPNDISPALQEKLTRVRIIFSNIGDAISISTAEMSRPELKRLQGYFDKGYIPKVNSNGRRPKIEWTSYLTWGDRFGEILTNLDDFMAASGIRRTPTDYDRTILELKEIVKRKFKGGPGSGNFGHAGIPGHRGGSAPDDTFVFTKTKYYNDTEENIRDTIAKMLPAANEYYGNRYKDYTPERYMEECNQRLREILANAEVCVRITEDNLNEVLDDGVYESVFSTRRSAAGMYNNASKRKYLSYRKEFENKVFGIEDDQKEGRPVYGFLVDGLSDGVDTSYSNMTLQMYGNVTIVLNGSVKDRSTWTDADSLDYAFREVPSYHGKMVYRALPTPITNPSVISSIEPASGTDILAVYNESRTGGMGGSYGYWEAQIHGGFRLSDIKEVVFQNQPSEQTAERLARNGIPWRIAKKAGVKP